MLDKWIDLSGLPTKQSKNKRIYNWMDSAGCIVPFKYGDILGEIEIIEYIQKQKIVIKYQDKLDKIATCQLIDCGLGRILGKISADFKIDIGTHFIDNKRDIIIVNREYRKNNNYNVKWYEYVCQKCHYHGWAIESSLLNGTGCSCCANQVTVEGINSIVDREPWMIPYFIGGYDEAKLYMPNSQKKIELICPDCGNIKTKKIQDLYKNHSLGCSCSDHVSFAEKFMIQLFKQLNINIVWQANKSYFSWISDLISYDFYLPDYNCIVETHGDQHYHRQGNMRRTLIEEQSNDKYKENLATNNHIENYVVIDCKDVSYTQMMNNVLNSNLFNIINVELSQINWNDCLIKASKNIIKEVCVFFTENPDMTTTEIGKIFKRERHTILYYLKFGTKFNWCTYDVENEKRKRIIKVTEIIKQNSFKPIEVFKNSISLGIFPTTIELANQSEKILGIKLQNSNIYETVRGKYKQYKGFTFKYIDKEKYNKLKGETNE